jgi:hypothetical protein
MFEYEDSSMVETSIKFFQSICNNLQDCNTEDLNLNYHSHQNFGSL